MRAFKRGELVRFKTPETWRYGIVVTEQGEKTVLIRMTNGMYLRRFLDEVEHVYPAGRENGLREGDRITVKDGVYKGQAGTIKATEGEGVLFVILDGEGVYFGRDEVEREQWHQS